MVQFVFEDSSSSPISLLLKNSIYGENIHFSNGNEYLARTANKILKQGEEVYIFMDVPPNREDIVSSYDLLCMYYDGNENVKVFPIVCIEEIVIRMLRNYKYLTTNNEIEDLVLYTIDEFKPNMISPKHKSNEYIMSSLEHLYKYILTQASAKCIHNSNNDDITGLFYRQSCICERKYCKIDCSDSYDLKAERLYTSLPVYCSAGVDKSIDKWNLFNIEYSEIPLKNAYTNIARKYNMICDSLGIGRLVIHFNKDNDSDKVYVTY